MRATEPAALISNELWRQIEPLMSPRARKRGRLDDRTVLEGILYVLEHDIPWYGLPKELGYGSGMSGWRRLREWHQSGAWLRLQPLLQELLPERRFNFSRIVGDQASAKPRGRRRSGRRVRASFVGVMSPTAPPPLETLNTSQWFAAPRKSAVPISPFADA